jgi:N4-gp56 family major capsid protein
MYGGSATSISTVGGTDDSTSRTFKLTESLTTSVYGTLIENKAKPMARLIAGQNKIGTKPVPESFYIVVGTRYHNALINKDLFPEFQSIEEYSDPSVRMSINGMQEIGRIGRFRIIFSELLPELKHKGAKVGDGSAASTKCWSSQDSNDSNNYHYDVSPCIVMSQDAISTVGLQGKTKHMIYTQFPEQIDGTNPIGERGYVAFKFRYASIITKPEALAIAYVTCPIPD